MKLTERLLIVMRRHSLTSPNDRVIVAVSGGADSLALLHMLHSVQRTLTISLHVATFDHQLRGEASAADARFVVETAEQLGLPVTAGNADVRALAERERRGIEAAARKARYEFLAEVARTNGARIVATGHHADDQVETVLMHLLRGAGLQGLSGMSFRTGLPTDPRIRLIRPLLGFRRAELEAYCAEHGLTPRHDVTNDDPNHTRNRLRLITLPALREINPQIEQAIIRLADSAHADDRFIARLAHEAFRECVIVDEPGERVILKLHVFRHLEEALKRRVLRQAVAFSGGHTITHEQILSAIDLVTMGQHGGRAEFSGGVIMRLEYDRLIFEWAESTTHTETPYLLPESAEIVVNTEGVTDCGGWSLNARPGQLERAQARLAIPVGSEITLRTRRDGDFFLPHGLNGRRQPINRWMINRKIPPTLRNRIPLLLVNEDIAAILWGARWHISHQYLVDENTSQNVSFFTSLNEE